MSVPKYQRLFLPILEFASDQETHKIGEAIDAVANYFDLDEASRKELLPSGTQTRLYNRTTWAITYLEKAGLLCKPKRGCFEITEDGLSLLHSDPRVIDNDTLLQYESFQEFRDKKNTTEDQASTEDDSDGTPEELIEQSITILNQSLAGEVSEALSTVDPGRFEQIVVDLLVAMGYGGSRADAARVIGKPGDGGIDGTIKEDRLGLDVIYVQAKRWQGPVGRKEIQSFAGSLEGERASKGIFITTSSYTRNAIEYVKNIGKRIILIDGEQLAELMITHGVGVTRARAYTISKLDSDYYEDG
ncbi:MAG: restriction endonuclease [bacterium]|nr:restriction endonuclease [bacterium]